MELINQQFVASIVILNVAKAQPLLADSHWHCPDSDVLCSFERVWEDTRRLLQNIPDDDEFMFRLVINRIVKFKKYPELVKACPSKLANLYAWKALRL